MGVKRILDLTSTKKHDTMMGLNVMQTPGTVQVGVSLGSTHNFMLWCPTARARGGQNNNSAAIRAQDDVYWKGISDHLHIESTTSDPWLWRRIIYTKKTNYALEEVNPSYYVAENMQMNLIPALTGSVPPNSGAVAAVYSYSRSLEELPVANYGIISERLFQGIRNIDYSSFSTAKVDKSQAHVLYDRTRRITSGNDSGVMRNYKQWIPLNKRMRYANLEEAALDSGDVGRFASDGTYGNWLDDVYILDYFEQSAAAPGSLNISGNATAFWHEK
jgi:hypothetical protein